MSPSGVYSKRFLQAASHTGSLSATVPDGVIWIVRDIDCYDVSATDGDLVIFLGALGQGIWTASKLAGSGISFSWRGRQVFSAGESFAIDCAVGVWGFAVSGYELTSP